MLLLPLNYIWKTQRGVKLLLTSLESFVNVTVGDIKAYAIKKRPRKNAFPM